MNKLYINNCEDCEMDEKDFVLLNDVNIDNVCSKLNLATQGHYSYDVEVITATKLLLKVTLMTPIKTSVGISELIYNGDMNIAIRTALVQACKIGFDCTGIIEEEKVTPEKEHDYQATFKDGEAVFDIEKIEHADHVVAASSLDELENELGIQHGAPIPFNPTVPQEGNKFGIRPDQIAFMKTFQEALKIDTTEKFDEYVKAWSMTESAFAVSTKAELITCGGMEGVDLFISWVKEVYKDNIANNNFVCPSDNQFEEACK